MFLLKKNALALLLMLPAAGSGNFEIPIENVIEKQIQESRDKPIAARLVHVTQSLLGAPYRHSPLGEGLAHIEDPDPRIRLDAFDCTTFVETSMAFSLADNYAEAKGLLDVIRYRGGNAHFMHRRHFPESEWIPELIQMGFFEDITRRVGGDEVIVETKKLNPSLWAKRRKNILGELPEERIPTGESFLDVWPLKKAHQGHEKIPPGTILNLVRVNRKRIPVRVSHQGLVIRKEERLYLRHAADRMYHAVVDEPLEKFFSRMMAYRKWPVAGVHLLSIREPKGWRDAYLRWPAHAAWPSHPTPLP
jgi:hypothetical protein